MRLVPIFFFLCGCFGGFDSFEWNRPTRISSTAVLVDYVDPFIGTSGVWWASGHSAPAATAPSGIVKLGPDSALLGKTISHSGYAHNDPEILGFSINRYTGTGVAEGGAIRFTPFINYESAQAVERKRFVVDKKTEMAHAGYYSVYLHQEEIKVELTASNHAGMHRYEFETDDPYISVDLTGAHKGSMKDVSATVAGSGFSGNGQMWSGFSQRYSGLPTFFDASFSASVSESFFIVKRSGTWVRENVASYTSSDGEKVRLILKFDLDAGTPLLARVGLSYTGAAGASAHLASIGGTSFEDLRSATEDLWQNVLNNFIVRGGTEKQKRIFYSSLYRAFLMPTRFSDADNTYLGFDGATHAGASAYYSDLSLWDTFRTNFPLYYLSYPTVSSDLVESLLLMYQEGGTLPRWASGAGYPNSMLGVPAVITLSEAFQKGVGSFDSDLALTASLEALSKTPSGVRGKECLSSYIDLGFCPYESLDGSVSYTLEYAYGDHALAQFYKAKGNNSAYETYLERSRNAMESIFDHRFKSFLPKSRSGDFVDLGPNGPAWHDSSYLKLGKTGKSFVEGGVLHWRFYPIFDSDFVAGLFGDSLLPALNRNFRGAKDALGGAFPPYHYWHGNEPGFMQAFWYSLKGSLFDAQRWIHWIQTKKYSDTANGLDGDDDGGTLSAWYVLSAIGIFPIAGTDRYVLSNPVFESVEIDIGSGESFTITKTQDLTDKVYLNNVRLEANEITHSDIVDGAELRFGDE